MNQFVGLLQHFYHSALRKDKHDWEIISYCIGTAALFWFLNAMGKVYHHHISIPVQYQYAGKSYLPVSSMPDQIEVNVVGKGWDLAGEIWSWKPKIQRIRISKPLEMQYLIPAEWLPNLKTMLPAVQVEGVATDTIFCRFDRIEKKLVGLYVDLQDIKLREGYQISSPIQISPKYIEFVGAASLIKNLPALLPVKIDARNINSSFDQNVAIDFSEEYPKNQLLNYDQDVVNVQFTVRPTLEEEIQIPLEVVNGAVHPNLFLKERKVLVNFLVSEKDKKQIKVTDFQVVADIQTFNPADSTVEVLLKRQPDFVSDVQIGISKTKVYARP